MSNKKTDAYSNGCASIWKSGKVQIVILTGGYLNKSHRPEPGRQDGDLFIHKLNEEFEKRKQKNSRYSLRSYARFLKVNPGTLSAILKGKRSMPPERALEIVKRLGLEPSEKNKIMADLFGSSSVAPNSVQLVQDDHSILFHEWEYFAILGLFRLSSFESSVEWISKKAEVPELRVMECLEVLMRLKLIVLSEQGHLVRVHQSVQSSHNVPSEAVRAAHKNNLILAAQKIETLPMEEREFSFLTVALDGKGFHALKKLMGKFRESVFDLDEKSRKQRVYRVSMQCFPLSSE